MKIRNLYHGLRHSSFERFKEHIVIFVVVDSLARLIVN